MRRMRHFALLPAVAITTLISSVALAYDTSLSLPTTHSKMPLMSTLMSTPSPALLDPVRSILSLPELTPNQLEDNLYIALMGFNYPHDDYYTVGKNLTERNYNQLKKTTDNFEHAEPYHVESIIAFLFPDEAPLRFDNTIRVETQMDPALLEMMTPLGELPISTQLSDWERKAFPFPCRSKPTIICYQQVIDDEALHTEIKANKPNEQLMERYLELRKFKHFEPIAHSLVTPSPDWNSVLKLSEMRMADAVLKMSRGDTIEGLTELLEERQFMTRFMATGKKSDLSAVLMAHSSLKSLSYLIESFLFQSQSDRRQLTKEENALVVQISAPLDEAYRDAIYEGIRNESLAHLRTLPIMMGDALKEDPNALPSKVLNSEYLAHHSMLSALKVKTIIPDEFGLTSDEYRNLIDNNINERVLIESQSYYTTIIDQYLDLFDRYQSLYRKCSSNVK